MGDQMLDLCHPAKIANRLADTIVKGFGFGDRVSKLGHHSMDVSTVMAEFYEAFRMDKEGQSLTLLPPTMPMQTLDITFKFVEDISDADTNKGAGGTIPTEPVGHRDAKYDYRSIARKCGKTRCGTKKIWW